MLSKKAKQFVTDIQKEHGKDQEISSLYLIARGLGFSTDIFPAGYDELLDEFPLKNIFSDDEVKNDFLERYISLFPKGEVTSHDGKFKWRVRDSKVTVGKRMNVFLKSWRQRFQDEYHNLSKDEKEELILKATEAYLAERKRDGWVNTKKSVKFIYDDNGSLLETWINKTLEQGSQQKHREFVI